MKHAISPKNQRGVASTWIFGGFAAVALFFLLTEHRAHLYGWLPFLLLAACPLMHLFHGHGGHGGHGNHPTDDEPPRRNDASPVERPKDLDGAAPPAGHHHH